MIKQNKIKKWRFIIISAAGYILFVAILDVLFDVIKKVPIQVFWLGLILNIPIGLGFGYLDWRQRSGRRAKIDSENKNNTLTEKSNPAD